MVRNDGSCIFLPVSSRVSPRFHPLFFLAAESFNRKNTNKILRTIDLGVAVAGELVGLIQDDIDPSSMVDGRQGLTYDVLEGSETATVETAAHHWSGWKIETGNHDFYHEYTMNGPWGFLSFFPWTNRHLNDPRILRNPKVVENNFNGLYGCQPGPQNPWPKPDFEHCKNRPPGPSKKSTNFCSMTSVMQVVQLAAESWIVEV